MKPTVYYHLCAQGLHLEESENPDDFQLVNAKTQKEVRDFLDTLNHYDIQDSKDNASDPDPVMPANIIDYANLSGFNVVTTSHPI
jgi:hypothetical protein